ncbi:Protein phosphatase 2C-like protein 1 [Golovinomyces cichoracearum]|uniref:Protein phosphatase 2C-like protein 1 n=1 Tax=Golovinomyces cichoracearum TaxID=62708 RepID=A0A420J538_9PEZI|nr:Protein phosphatase 2C-like protein 1 [Golovinomyces cichoracearum]
MFGGTVSPPQSKDHEETKTIDTSSVVKCGDEKSEESSISNGAHNLSEEKKSSGSLIANAGNSLHLSQNNNSSGLVGKVPEQNPKTPLQKLGEKDTALSVPQGPHNNSAGESHPGPRSTFTVGVWEDRNKKCRRTMEDTHAFLYNFLHTPAPDLASESLSSTNQHNKGVEPNNLDIDPGLNSPSAEMIETDNGYFAIFDGHAGTFAADWCGKKLHIILEDLIRANPNIPIPELLDQTFTSVDAQLEKLPLKNSGCTAVIAILRWEDRKMTTSIHSEPHSLTPESLIAAHGSNTVNHTDRSPITGLNGMNSKNCLNDFQKFSNRQRVLYTANVGDARVILCRNGRALRLSYDHKGSDELEGKRVASAGGLILNNRVNGVLAVTRALGDNYMKDLVTGHPYTTETVIQPDIDEFLVLACDGIWDVCTDQEAVNLVREINEPTSAAKRLVDYALAHFSTDNLSCMIVRFKKSALLAAKIEPNNAIGVEGDPNWTPGKISEAEKIVGEARRKFNEDRVPGVGISGSNFGRGHDSNLDCLKREKNGKENSPEEQDVLDVSGGLETVSHMMSKNT